MAYEKPFLTVSDHAVGLQCVNRALENNRALYRDQFDPTHSVGVGGSSLGDPFLGPGRHDDPLIARTVADFTLDAAGAVAVSLVTGPLIFDAPTKVDTGQWVIYVTTPRLFSAVACIKGASIGAPRHATCHVSMDLNGPYVTVSTWDFASSARISCDFSLALWAEAVA